MKTFLYTLVLAIAALAGSLAFSTGSSLAADCEDQKLTPKQQIQCGVDTAAGGSSAKPPAKTAQDIVTEVINVLSLVGGALAVIMIIYGGLRYVVSAGNQEATKSAKNTIIYALAGLVIIAIAQVIVQFVLVKSTHATTSTGSPTTSSGSGSTATSGSASHQAP